MKPLLLSTVLLAALAAAAGPSPQDDAATIAAQKPSYPLTTCLVSGEELGSEGMKQVDLVHEGKLVSLCCKSCQKDFLAAPAEFMKKRDDAVIAAQKAGYPLDTCPLSGEALGAQPTLVVAGTKLVQVCCKDCAKEVAKDATAALAKVDAAYIEKQSSDYPLATCPMSGEELGERPVKLLHGTTLVQFCCKDCAKEFQKDPKPALAKLAAARAKPAGAPEKPASK